MATLNIGIIIGSTREGRVSPQVGAWVLKQAQEIAPEVQFEILDVKDFNLPFLGTSSDMEGITRWNQALASKDGFIFVVSEYNHSIAASLKNALDSAKDAWANKAAGIVSYGSAYGARADEHLRNILSELQVASVRTTVLLSLFTDFDANGVFTPAPMHKNNMTAMLGQLQKWATALKTIR